MNKLDSKIQSVSVSSASSLNLRPVRHLIVLVPSLEFDFTAITHRLWNLANSSGAHIHFIALYNDAAQEPALRRELITMSALVKDGKVSAEADTIFGKDWVDVVKTQFQDGDMVVCFAEHRVGVTRRPLSQLLQAGLNVPIYIVSNLSQKAPRSNWLSQIAVWAGSTAIIFGFFALQVKVGRLASGLAYSLLLLLSIPFEFWALWAWNALIG